MARGGYRVGAGRPRKSEKRSEATAPASDVTSVQMEDRSPLEHMLAVMNNPLEDNARRDRMAIAAAPFIHPRAGEVGKKETKEEAAKKAASGRFAPPQSPAMN